MEWGNVCGEDVPDYDKKTGDVKHENLGHYWNQRLLKVQFNGKKISVQFGKDTQWVEMVCKTEKMVQ